jgi:FkbM family methyltransferase
MSTRSAPQNPGAITAYLAEVSTAERELARVFAPDEVRLIFDIGSCEAEDAIRYARAFPQARVYAFEPLPSNQALIRANLEVYGLADRVELVPVALCDRVGEAEFHVSSGRPPEAAAEAAWNYGNKSSSLLTPGKGGPIHSWLKFKQSIQVITTTLDAFCAERGLSAPDFIHLDVQGAEGLVLKGGGKTLRHTAALWIEVADAPLYAGQPRRAEVEQTLRRLGFAMMLDQASGEGVEHDQFYLNLHRARTWGPWLRRRLGYAWLRLRQG